MAGIRQLAVVHFHTEGGPRVDTYDFTSLAWELLTQGVTRRLLRRTAGAVYRRAIRPVFQDDSRADGEDMARLEELGLEAATYKCKLRVPEEMESGTPPPSKGSGRIGVTDNDDKEAEPVPELFVRINVPRLANEDFNQRHAIAYSIIPRGSSPLDFVRLDPERVHTKWSTNVARLKLLYHEARVYEHFRQLKDINVTPKFYGFYEDFARTDPFGISIFERSNVFPSPNSRDNMDYIIFMFVKAAQTLHKNGICHGGLLEKKPDGSLAMTNNVRVVIENSVFKRVVFVNFEHASRHKGFGCPSAESKKFTPRGCRELDDIYKFLHPWQEKIKTSAQIVDDDRDSIFSI